MLSSYMTERFDQTFKTSKASFPGISNGVYLTPWSGFTVTVTSESAFLLPLPANDRSALEIVARNFSSADLAGVNVADLAYTLGERHTKYVSGGYFLASQSTIKEALQYENFRLTRPGGAPVNLLVCFVFAGQGAQWASMGKELLEEFPTFKESIMSLDSTLKNLPHPPPFCILDVILLDRPGQQASAGLHGDSGCLGSTTPWMRYMPLALSPRPRRSP